MRWGECALKGVRLGIALSLSTSPSPQSAPLQAVMVLGCEVARVRGTSWLNLKMVSGSRSLRSSKKMPPSPRVSPRCLPVPPPCHSSLYAPRSQ
jgi:hypothetical protein